METEPQTVEAYYVCPCGSRIKNYPCNLHAHKNSKRHIEYLQEGKIYSDTHINKEYPTGHWKRYKKDPERHRVACRIYYLKRKQAQAIAPQ